VNWCQHWFEYFPNPPLHVLNVVEDLLIHHDSALFESFKDHKITAQIYAWPLLQCMFACHFSKEQWFILMDHIIVESPDFIFYIVISYLKYHRDTLLRFTEMKDFKVKTFPCANIGFLDVCKSC
jgi:hypothetical protein